MSASGAAPSRGGHSPDDGMSPVGQQHQFSQQYSTDGMPVGDIWTSKTIAKAIGGQVKDSNTHSRDWIKQVNTVEKEFQSAFNAAVRNFCKKIEALARLQDKFQKEVGKKTLYLDQKLSKANVALRAGKKGAEKKKTKLLAEGEKIVRALETKYAAPLFNAATQFQRSRAYFSEVMLKYWEKMDKASCDKYNLFVDLDEQLTHEAINIDFSGLSMLFDKLNGNGARMGQPQYVLIPKELRTLPKMNYKPKREYLRIGKLIVPKEPTTVPTTTTTVPTAAVPAAAAAPVDDTALKALEEENEQLKRQLRLVKMTLQNEVESNAKLRYKVQALGGELSDSDSD
mmetsp:Transcript_16837/g.25154  ORF Transcript_16837/g.25154 Transcript_16837/m.25154 type:complete len:341 (-) Transcript_16837:36-1058(-)|eukprot:CAMPEP_0201555598 /NCGR_PEP_ID=MMETSP0173_2-20130828/49967_1 /ASSEMBLY_ACC=CAM_ASM_000268 /TAXON_ID=218659 /ORGANISM="Vexillifera sp., Strain DIVA3 564/2" /LENGTH=340 /DNA_ID=CAMNT_0047967465 /DNA_START=35 /DNA_END=1057 /DNA_ORIENTATION=+